MSNSHEQGLKDTKNGLILLGTITIVEVMIALYGNGHIIEGHHLPKLVMYPVMILLSLYKAYYIVFYFMHMRYETRGLALSVLLPVGLLIWAIIAFLSEGGYWHNGRAKVINETDATSQPAPETHGSLYQGEVYHVSTWH